MIRKVNWRDRENVFMQRKLREVEDYESFMQFFNKIKGSQEIRSKRSGRRAFSFSEDKFNKAKCHYLIDDGHSTGLCRWENLHNVLFVEDI